MTLSDNFHFSPYNGGVRFFRPLVGGVKIKFWTFFKLISFLIHKTTPKTTWGSNVSPMLRKMKELVPPQIKVIILAGVSLQYTKITMKQLLYLSLKQLLRNIVISNLFASLHCTVFSYKLLFQASDSRLKCTCIHCTVLHCTSHHYTALQCITLHCTALHCIALQYTALHSIEFTSLHCILVQFIMLHISAMYCTSLQNAVLHIVQCTSL